MAATISGKKTQNILSHQDRSLEFLFAIDRVHRPRLSYFFTRIDFAGAGAEINAEQLALRKKNVKAAECIAGAVKKHPHGLMAESGECKWYRS